MSYDQDALDAASREVHMHLLREGSSWGTKACEEMGRIFMTAYLKAAPAPEGDARWQTMETAPKDGTHVLVLHGGTVSEAWWAPHGFRSEVCWGGKGWSYAEWSQPTHWHPMPPLPSDVRALPQRGSSS